jgi:hypothetical protein
MITCKEKSDLPLTVLSFGAGQDSTFILYKLLLDQEYRTRYAQGKLIVIMADTGNEHPNSYRHLEFCRELCAQHRIEFYLLGDEWRSNAWKGGLKGHYRRYDVVMGKAMGRKSCTDQLKIQPIYRFLATYLNDNYLNGMFRPENKQSLKVFTERFGKVDVLLGISAEEAARRIDKTDVEKQPVYMRTCINKRYPLAEEGLTRRDCQNGIREMGLPLPYPSNCIWCPFLSKIELVWLYRNLPGELEELKERELAKLTKFSSKEKNFGVFGTKQIDDVLKAALKEFGHMTDKELDEYKMSHGHCVASAY